MKTRKHFLLAILLLGAFGIKAQVGVGTSSPASSSQLDLTSTTKGFLPPRMTRVQRNAISSPIAGLMIWCNDCGVFGQIEVYDGTGWTNMMGGMPNGLTIGDPYAGGIVAYILQPTDPGYVAGQIHGLIAAQSDQSPGQWGCIGTLISGTSTLLGTGQANTTIILAGCITVGIAADICDDLVLNGYSDWYLPSKVELNKLYLNQVAIGGFSGLYWSSSEQSMDFAWSCYFANGSQGVNYKDYVGPVRAIRSF